MRVLVTGAGGFVGSAVVRHLLDAGVEVAALVRSPDVPVRLEGLGDRVHMIRGDLDDPTVWREQVAGWKPEACVHTAWYAEPGKYLDSTESIRGLSFSLGLLEELARAGCQNVVMTGTCFEYDTSVGWVDEQSPVKPGTLYAACKLGLGLVAAQRATQLGVNFAWGRIFYVYGPYEDERRLVPALTKSLLADRDFAATTGDQVRDYMHVADVAAGLASLALAGAQGVFNVSSAEPVTLAEVMLTVGRIIGREDLIKFGARAPAQFEPAFICGRNDRLRQATGWAPGRTLYDGLRTTVEWWKARS